MNVREIIERLQRKDPEKEVVFWHTLQGTLMPEQIEIPISKVTQDKSRVILTDNQDCCPCEDASAYACEQCQETGKASPLNEW